MRAPSGYIDNDERELAALQNPTAKDNDSETRPMSMYSVTVRWNSSDQQHVFVACCDRCGEEFTSAVGKHGSPSSGVASWMINHRTSLTNKCGLSAIP